MVSNRVIMDWSYRTDTSASQYLCNKMKGDYDSYVSKFAKASEAALKDSVDPNIVADAIIAAATDGTKRLRYPVGKPAPAMLRLRTLVSDSMFFKLIKKAYGM